MSFIRGAFASQPLHTVREFVLNDIRVATELGMPDIPGAVICSMMCKFQEAGADLGDGKGRQIWCPGNDGDPHATEFPYDSWGNDGRSTGSYQQQMNAPGETPWGWGGVYGDPEGTRKRMDMYESTKLFMADLKKKGYDASNAQAANDSIQRVQRSGAPQAYKQWWALAHSAYDAALKDPVTPVENTGGTVGWRGDPVWLADVVKPAVKKFGTIGGWDQDGHGDFQDIWGVMIHHTGNSNESAASISQGRSDLPGPLANLHIAKDGTVTAVAVGVCWHAGAGSYPGIPEDMANYHVIGIECAWPDIAPDGSYDPGQRWPDAQIIAMRDTTAAILKKLGVNSSRVIGHKEWAGAKQGKWDPGNMSMDWFRGEVQKAIDGKFGQTVPTPPIVTPPQEPVLKSPYKDNDLEVLIQTRGRFAMLGDRTLVEALSALLLDAGLITKEQYLKQGVVLD